MEAIDPLEVVGFLGASVDAVDTSSDTGDIDTSVDAVAAVEADEAVGDGKGGKAVKRSKAVKLARTVEAIKAAEAVTGSDTDEVTNPVKPRKPRKPRKPIKKVKSVEAVKVVEQVKPTKSVNKATNKTADVNESVQAMETKISEVKDQLALLCTEIKQQKYKMRDYKTAISRAAKNNEPTSPYELLFQCASKQEVALINLRAAVFNVKIALVNERAEVVAAAKSAAIVQDASDLKRILKIIQAKLVKETPLKRKPKRKLKTPRTTHMKVVVSAGEPALDQSEEGDCENLNQADGAVDEATSRIWCMDFNHSIAFPL